jgi:cation:H+ antiporter
MLTSILAIIGGFVLLVWGADRFVAGASATARNLGVSPLIIGLTIVGFGTSAPEMLVSAMAAAEGNPNMGIGNALGSNITNIGLVLGITALITPLAVHSETLKREFPILFAIMLLALLLLMDSDMAYTDGLILMAGLGVMIYWMISLGIRERNNSDPMESEFSDEIPSQMPMKTAIFWLVLGMLILLGSSRMLVWGSVNVAQAFGISDLIIGLTIIAIGTSLPELAASVMSALKGEHDIAVGNVLGSNMFNLLAVLGMPGLIMPTATPPEMLSRDFPVMIGLSIALFAMGYGFLKPGHITRAEGGLLLTGYFVYMGMLYHASIA